MNYDVTATSITQEEGVEQSTMMKTPCLRYRGGFMTMMLEKEDALIIKVSAERVAQIIMEGKGREFSFTKKRFKEWVLIPLDYKDDYEAYIYEALIFAREKASPRAGA